MQVALNFITLLVTGVITGAVAAETVTVASAANFVPTLQKIVLGFEANTDHTVKVVSGSSGKLYAQLLHGAPFDIFLSADQSKPANLVSRGLAQASHRYTYASGQLVLWSKNPTLITDGLPPASAYRKMALANPRLAPYGVAAVEVLDQLGTLQESTERWVQGENVTQTLQFIVTGGADLGFIARSQWLPFEQQGSSWSVPQNYHSPIHQDAVLLNKAVAKTGAQLFFKFLSMDQARALITKGGYLLANPSGHDIDRNDIDRNDVDGHDVDGR